jgi:transposase
MTTRKKRDPKTEALRESRTLNPRPDAVTDETFMSSDFFDTRDVVQVKYEMLRRVSEDGASVSSAAAAFGFSRQSYYHAAAALAAGGLQALVPAKPGPRGGHKLTGEVLDHITALLAADPALRPAELADAVARRFGRRVHPRSIERALKRARRLAEPWYDSKTEPSFEGMIAKLRRTLITARFTEVPPGHVDPDLLRDYSLACAEAAT